MKAKDRKNLLNKKGLAQALGMSSTTLWRVLKANQTIARRYKLRACPQHRSYASGHKYYFADEVQGWLDYVNEYSLSLKK